MPPRCGRLLKLLARADRGLPADFAVCGRGQSHLAAHGGGEFRADRERELLADQSAVPRDRRYRDCVGTYRPDQETQRRSTHDDVCALYLYFRQDRRQLARGRRARVATAHRLTSAETASPEAAPAGC